MTAPTSSFTIRDYPDARLAEAFNAEGELIALAIELPSGYWLVRDFRHGAAVDIHLDGAVAALQALNAVAGLS